MTGLAAPFPWFGGKRKVAPEVWAALGDPDNYIEPFAGSLAVLLNRPPFGPDVNLPRLLAWLDRADEKPMLWEAS